MNLGPEGISKGMEHLITNERKEVWFHQIERPFLFESPFPGRRYVCIVFSNDETVTDTERDSVTRALFDSGCRYGVFTGHKCDNWEWALDTACLESDPDYKPSEEAFTMTTSHKNESVQEVVFFGLVTTVFDTNDYDRFLILFIGPSLGLRDEVTAAIRTLWSDSGVV